MVIDKTSPLYQVRHWRNANQDVEQVLQDFIFYLQYDCDDIPESTIKSIQSLIDSFLGFAPMDQIKQYELGMLAHWKQSAIDTESNHA